MRVKVLFALVAVCVAFMAAESFAQLTCYSAPDTCQVCWDPQGKMTFLDLYACDTVRIGCPVCVSPGSLAVGDSFQVPIYVFNDQKLGGFSIPFRHYGTKLKFGYGGDYGVDFEGTSWMTAVQQSALNFTPDGKSDTASLLIGWADFSSAGRPIPANTGSVGKLMGYLYLVLEPGVTIPQVVRFDTAFYPPAGPLIFTNDRTVPNTPSIIPKFVICQNFTPPCDIALPVTEVNGGNLPQKFELGQNIPNPFNPNTVIQFAVPRPAEVRVEVFNVLGQKVRTLANEFSKAGYKRVEWDGTDDNGSSVASGVYLYRMTAGDFSETKKMLLLK